MGAPVTSAQKVPGGQDVAPAQAGPRNRWLEWE